MRFYNYYTWLRYLLITPSYNFKNRLFIEKFNQSPHIHSFLGETYKSFSWHTFSSSNLSNFWLTINTLKFILFFLFQLYLILLIYSIFFTGSNLTFVYTFKVIYYIVWRVLDFFYFFILQIQYMFITYFIYFSFNLLNSLTTSKFNPSSWLHKQFAEHPFITGSSFVNKYDRIIQVDNYILKNLINSSRNQSFSKPQSTSTFSWSTIKCEKYTPLILNYFRLHFLFSISDFIYLNEFNHSNASNWLNISTINYLINSNVNNKFSNKFMLSSLCKLLTDLKQLNISFEYNKNHILNHILTNRINLIKLIRWINQSTIVSGSSIRSLLSEINLTNSIKLKTLDNNLLELKSNLIFKEPLNYLYFRLAWYSQINFYFKGYKQFISGNYMQDTAPSDIQPQKFLIYNLNILNLFFNEIHYKNNVRSFKFIKPLNISFKENLIDITDIKYRITTTPITKLYHFDVISKLYPRVTKNSLIKLH